MSHRSPLRLAVALLFALCASGGAQAQSQSITGEFEPFNSWWIHPTQGTLGIFYDGSLIRIDRDATANGAPPDGVAESLFLRPAGQTGIPDAAIGSLRLTPSRTIVYAFGGVCNGNGTLVYFYRVPAGSSNRLEPIVTGQCIPHGIDRLGFYDTGLCAEPNGIGLGLDCTGRQNLSPRRIAMFVTPATAFGAENLVWVDLTSGVVANSGFDFSTGMGFLHVSPSGTQAFVQHDLPVPGETDYRMIDLCPGTSFGQVVNPGGFPIANSNEQLSAAVTAVSAGEVTIQVTNPAQVVRDEFSFTDCLVETGACCYAGGFCNQSQAAYCYNGDYLGSGTACSECPEPPVIEACCFAEGNPNCSQLEADECSVQGGTPQSGVEFCSFDLCPGPDPTLALSGPTSGQIGDTLDYGFEYENAGGVIARDVQVQVQLPYGATNISAPGASEIQGELVTWSLGDLAPGAGGTLAFAFTLGCETFDVYFSGWITNTPLGGGGTSYAYSNEIVFTPDPLPTAALAVSVASTPARVPLLPNDEAEHTITVTNPSGVSVAGVRVGTSDSSAPIGIVYGNATGFDRVVDAAGGVVDTTGNRLLWTGDVGAGQSRAIRFVTQMNACIPPGVQETQLNFGSEIAAFDACGTQIGISAEPQTFAVESIAAAELLATNLAPPQRLDAPILSADVQLTRPGGAAQVEITLESNTGDAIANASATIEVRGLAVTTPPSGPGIVWNSGSQTISWSGSIPSSAPVSIEIAGNVTACRAEFELEGSTAPGCNDLRGELLVPAVPVPPAGPWLAGIATRPGPFGFPSLDLVRVDPTSPATVTTMLCLPNEYMTGIDAAPDGTIWAVWLPSWSVNPATLAFEAIEYDEPGAAGIESISDVAIDPVDGAVYFSGSRYDPTLFQTIGTIARRDPVTHAYTTYFEDESVTAFGELVVDASGVLFAVADRAFTSDAVARIDPGIPPTATYFGSVGMPVELALDSDGSVLVIDRYGAPPQLRDVDSTTGAVDVVIPDLTAPFPNTFGWDGLEVDGAGRIFVAPAQPGLGAVDRSPSLDTETLIPIAFNGSNAFIDLAMVSRPIPEPGAAALAFATVAAFATLAARRRSRD